MFKICSVCNKAWQDREAFLADPDIDIIGYQASFEEGVKKGLFLFNHQCKTTLALRVITFDDLYRGPRYETELTGTDVCSGYCLDIKELSACSAKCKYAYVREIIQMIRKWPKDD
jgi:hypothetical protein